MQRPKQSPGTALVTGGSIRIGKAISLALAARGYDIALHYNSSEAASVQTAEEIKAYGVAVSYTHLTLPTSSQV